MRDAVFRGKRLETNEWVYGGLHKHQIFRACPIENFDSNEQLLIVNDGFISNTTENPVYVIPIKYSTAGQYTGLPDKNSKKIFEGDIIEYYGFYGYVLFEDGMFIMSGIANTQFGKYKQPLCYHDSAECEVIGNIHDNPELLEV